MHCIGCLEDSNRVVISQEEPVELAASKRCSKITTVVLAILVIIAFSLLLYLERHPVGPLIPNIAWHWSQASALVGFEVVAIGFVISFLHCVHIHKWLVNKDLEQQIKILEQQVADLKEYRKKLI